jgi:hypothetical protein
MSEFYCLERMEEDIVASRDTLVLAVNGLGWVHTCNVTTYRNTVS